MYSSQVNLSVLSLPHSHSLSLSLSLCPIGIDYTKSLTIFLYCYFYIEDLTPIYLVVSYHFSSRLMSCYLNLSCLILLMFISSNLMTYIIFARMTITATLKLLQNLPVWVVIRLCTDDESMVDYWNSIETQVMLNMDVLDDPSGEAQEVLRYFSFLHSAVLYCIVLY